MAFNTQKLAERTAASGFVLKKRAIPKMRVWWIDDVSGSAQGYHKNGTAQLAFDTIYPIAAQVDDDGQMPCAIFADRKDWKILKEPMSATNWGEYVTRFVMPEAYWGGTDYDPVLCGVLEAEGFLKRKLLGGQKIVAKPNEQMTLIYFGTDGVNDPNGETGDKKAIRATLKAMQEAGANFYLMFIGIGRADFSFIEKLGEEFMNVGFVPLADLRAELERGDIYERLIPQELADWVARQR